MGDWAFSTIGDLARLRSGFPFKSSQWTEHGIPVVKIGNVKAGSVDLTGCSFVSSRDAEASKFELQFGDILIGLTGYVGQVARVRNKNRLVLNQRVGKFFPNAGCDPDFLFFLIANDAFRARVEAIAHGSAQPNVSPGAIERLSVLVPVSASDQKAIANVLSSLDDKIELNRRTNATLEGMAQAIFRDWFVDFGPVRRKLAGATDPVAILGGLIPDPAKAATVVALFPDALGDDGLPIGWDISNVGNWMDILDNRRIPLSSKERRERPGTIPYHGATGVMDFVDKPLFDEVLLLVGEDGSVARPDGKPFTQYVWGKIWVNNHAHVLLGKGISTEHLKCFFEQVEIAPYVTGAVQPKLNQGNMKAIPFIAATMAVNDAFSSLISPMYSRVRALVEENRTLAETRDYLLPRLMSGKVRVADTERAVA